MDIITSIWKLFGGEKSLNKPEQFGTMLNLNSLTIPGQKNLNQEWVLMRTKNPDFAYQYIAVIYKVRE